MKRKDKDYLKLYFRTGQRLSHERYQQLLQGDFSISFHIAYYAESVELQEQFKEGNLIAFQSPEGKEVIAYISRAFAYDEKNQIKHLYYFGVKK